jgi:hypothetical protein
MSTAELKLDLISEIAAITEKVKLKELLQLVKFQSEEQLFTTNDDEKKAITEARNQILEKKVSSNEEFQREIEQWLGK